jgi:peroxiredoxin
MAQLDQFKLHEGDIAPAFRLPGTDGRTWDSKDLSRSPWLLVVFDCNHCPYAQAWEGRLIALQKEFGPRGLQTVLINSNETENYPEDRMERMVERAKEKSYPFPYLRDDSQEVARAFGALVTPHPMLFDADRRLVYQGAVDDNHADERRVRHAYLRDAIETAMAGRRVSPSERPVLGCSIKWRA